MRPVTVGLRVLAIQPHIPPLVQPHRSVKNAFGLQHMQSGSLVRWLVIGKVNHGNYLSHSSVVYNEDCCITGIVKLKKRSCRCQDHEKTYFLSTCFIDRLNSTFLNCN